MRRAIFIILLLLLPLLLTACAQNQEEIIEEFDFEEAVSNKEYVLIEETGKKQEVVNLTTAKDTLTQLAFILNESN